MKRNILPIALASIFLGLLFDLLFYDKLPGISFFIYCTCILGLTVGLSVYYRQLLNTSTFLMVGVAIFFSATTAVRASGFLLFLDVVFTLYALLMVMQLALRPTNNLQSYTGRNYFRSILGLPFRSIESFFVFVRRVVSTTSEAGRQKQTITPVVRGVLLSLPFLAVFLWLFSSADLVFKRYIGSLVDLNLGPEAIGRLLLIFIVASAFVGAYSLLFTSSSRQQDVMPSTSRFVNLGTVESSIILGSVAGLFLIFVLIQITYLFGGESNITGTGLTYAEYARKGFFELIFVALISLALLLALHGSALRQTLRQKVLYMWLSGVLIVEVLVIMFSAHTRLQLYEETYGFTLPRLYSHIFIGWLAIVFGLLLFHIVRERRENQFALQVFLSVIAVLLFVNVLNPDAFVAGKNIDRFRQTGKIDLFYLGTLSEDALPAVSQLLDDPDESVRKSMARNLYFSHGFYTGRLRDDYPWQSFNISRSRAQRIYRKHHVLIESNKDYRVPDKFFKSY